ncbi:MAG TPA: redoxin domain-containing protein, partial [Lacipirellulaceae bacterium]|nr:redoxin domain-containing protein [Lacipirellulaceae bacterium]
VAVFVIAPAAYADGASTAAESSSHAHPQIGDKLASCKFTDIRYLPRTLSDFISDKDPVRKRAFVLVFTNTTCPIVQRYLPRLKELDATFSKQGVQFLAIDAGSDDSILEIATQAVEHDLPFPFVKDIDGTCAAACCVDRTATAVLLDADFRIRYRGRIDNSIHLGGATPGETRSELTDAIQSLLSNKDIATPETPVEGCLITTSAPATPVGKINYADQIAPIIEKNCACCHKPGTSAPFSLTSHDDVAANASMIAEVVDQRRMPPWYASPNFGKFTNDRTLSAANRKLLVAWARNGEATDSPSPSAATAATPSKPEAESLRGNSADVWAGKQWLLGEPDIIFEAPETYEVPAEGYVDYKYTLLPTIFLHDTYIQAAEVQPSNPRVVHHSNLGYMPIGTRESYGRLITGYVPGVGPMELDHNVASKIPAGSALGLQIHLVTNGKPEKTKLRVGFRYPRYNVDKELRYLELKDQKFAIPPFAAHYPVGAEKTLADDVTLYGFFSHMHVRGQDATYRAYPPKADPVTLLMIPNYNFDWQMPYHLPYGEVKFPAGTKYECTAHFDNTTFNPFNPDPTATVKDGQQTYQEMMYGYIFYTKDAEHLDLKIDPLTGRAE